MTEVRLGQKSFRQGQLWRDITAPPVPMEMSLKNQETESLQDSKGKNNREKLAQERFSLHTSNFFFPRRTVRQRHMLLRDTLSFQVPTNKMKP